MDKTRVSKTSTRPSRRNQAPLTQPASSSPALVAPAGGRSPTIRRRQRGTVADLSEVLGVREGGFSDADVSPPPSAGPLVSDETTVIEPNGKQLFLGIAAFDGDKINALRAYFDNARPLEQMLNT